MKRGKTRFQVFGAIGADAALVNVFPDYPSASNLLNTLRARYEEHGATFKISISISDREAPQQGTVSWRVLRDRLRHHERITLGTPRVRLSVQPITDEQIDAFLAAGHTATICRPHLAAAPKRRPDDRRFGLPYFGKPSPKRRRRKSER